MKDILPKEMAIRDYVIRLIKETYGTFGFTSMETPCVEHIENLNSKQGGENEKLIFKILKRGEKLKLETAEKENDLVDSGLRYDLTVPLCRYYSNNANGSAGSFLCKSCKRASVPVQSTSDGKCMACRPSAERKIPPVHAVRYRYPRRADQPRRD